MGRALVLWVPILGGMMLVAVMLSRRAAPTPEPSTEAAMGATSVPAPAPAPAPVAAPAHAGGSAPEASEHTAVPGSVTVVGGSAPSTPAATPSSDPSVPTAGGVSPPLTPNGPPSHLPAEVIRDTVREAMPFLRFCFEWQLDLHPELAGRLSMDWRILPDGTVADAAIAEDALHDETVLRCFRGVVGRLRFPPPEGGGEVTVRYPFVLSNAPEAERPEGI